MIAEGNVWPAAAVVAITVQLSACAPPPPTVPVMHPTAESYARWSLLDDRTAVLAPGALDLGERHLTCGSAQTVLNPNLNDSGAAFPDFIVINPNRIVKTPPVVQVWIYEHECGHIRMGPSERDADCYGITGMKREMGLSAGEVDQICRFIQDAKPDSVHESGADRCSEMKKCYREASS